MDRQNAHRNLVTVSPEYGGTDLNPLGLMKFDDSSELIDFALRHLDHEDDEPKRLIYERRLHQLTTNFQTLLNCSIEFDRNLAQAGMTNFIANAFSRSVNTLRQLHSVLNIYTKWCMANDVAPLPLTTQHIVRYVDHLQAEKRSSSTIDSHVTFLSLLRRLTNQESDPFERLELKDYLKTIRNLDKQRNVTKKQQPPFRQHHLSRLGSLWRSSEHLNDRRNLCYLLAAYDSMCRESEMIQLTLGMFSQEDTGDYSAELVNTKTTGGNKSADARFVWLSASTFHFIQETLQKFGVDTSDPKTPLFPSITRYGTVRKPIRPLNVDAVDGIFIKGYEVLQPEDIKVAWTGHSARIGRVQDLVMMGASETQIQQLGAWADSRMVNIYARMLKKSNLANQFRPL